MDSIRDGLSHITSATRPFTQLRSSTAYFSTIDVADGAALSNDKSWMDAHEEKKLLDHYVREDEWMKCEKMIFFPSGPKKKLWDSLMLLCVLYSMVRNGESFCYDASFRRDMQGTRLDALSDDTKHRLALWVQLQGYFKPQAHRLAKRLAPERLRLSRRAGRSRRWSITNAKKLGRRSFIEIMAEFDVFESSSITGANTHRSQTSQLSVEDAQGGKLSAGPGSNAALVAQLNALAEKVDRLSAKMDQQAARLPTAVPLPRSRSPSRRGSRAMQLHA